MWTQVDSLFSALLSICVLLTVVTTIVVIVLDNRNPVKTLAWVLVLIFLPVVGLIVYFFFGQDRRKERLISKKGYARLTKYPMAGYQQQKEFGCPDEYSQLIQFFRRVNGSLPFEGNAVQVYTGGYEMMDGLLRAISGAKHHVHLQSYIFEDDAVGRLVRDALADKARQGVEVRVLYDDVGCWNVPHQFYDEMLSMGIDVRPFLKVRFPRFTGKVNYRNHRKVAVVDGKIGFIGGMNIAMRYVKGVSWGDWRDTHIKLEGKAVYGLQTVFLMDWYATDHSMISSSKYYPEISKCGDTLIHIVRTERVEHNGASRRFGNRPNAHFRIFNTIEYGSQETCGIGNVQYEKEVDFLRFHVCNRFFCVRFYDNLFFPANEVEIHFLCVCFHLFHNLCVHLFLRSGETKLRSADKPYFNFHNYNPPRFYQYLI